MIFSDKVYNILKWICITVLPAVCTALFALGEIWGWRYVAEITTTMLILNTCLVAIVGVQMAQWNASDARFDGTIDPLIGSTHITNPHAEEMKQLLLKVEGSEKNIS